jgi:hypothetical protein
MGKSLTIKKAERRHVDLIKGQIWLGSRAEYKYLCKEHGVYLQIFNNHDSGKGCQKCGLARIRRAGGLSGTPEYRTVRHHFYYIFSSKHMHHESYRGMPFFNAWNPNKKGSWLIGARWIVTNLGKKPKGHTMHIVDHEKGFTPGNLEWADSRKQSAEKMFKIISNLKHRIKELEHQIESQEKA